MGELTFAARIIDQTVQSRWDLCCATFVPEDCSRVSSGHGNQRASSRKSAAQGWSAPDQKSQYTPVRPDEMV